MKISDVVLGVLSSAIVDGNNLFLTGQLDRKTYVDTNKVLEAAGGKWNRKEKAHIFDSDAAERIDQIIVSGSVEIPKDEFNFFPTPRELVDRMLDIANVGEGMLVLEPSAGKGAIASACVSRSAKVHCYELMDENFNTLKADSSFESVRKADFLTVEPEPIYDRVIMNPPFMKQSDIRHISHAYKFLKRGGLLVAIAGAGVLFRSNSLSVEFRAMVQEKGGTIEKLPEKSFKESGTDVNTVLITIPA